MRPKEIEMKSKQNQIKSKLIFDPAERCHYQAACIAELSHVRVIIMAGEWEKLNKKVRPKRNKKDPPFKVLKKSSTLAITAAIYWLYPSSHRNGRALSIQPKIPEISVRNETDQFSSVRLEYLGTPLKVVHFDRSGHFGRSDRIVPFHFDKIVFPSTALLYPPYKDNNQTCGGLGRVCANGMYRSIGHLGTYRIVEWKAPEMSNFDSPLT